MLDAAVCGAVFASPGVQQILQGLGYISSRHGTLMIVKNYTGDKLNFGLAAEIYQATAKHHMEMVVVQDDVSVPRSRNQKVGRRGLAGTVLVHKIAGAAASAGGTLTQVAQVAQYVANNIVTIGASLDHCIPPGHSEVMSLASDEIELGMGIHNEPGTRKISPQPDIVTLVDGMLDHLLNPNDPGRAYLEIHGTPQRLPVVLLVNNLGGLSVLEIHAISHVAVSRLEETYQIRPQRIYVGPYMTSLNGPGFSISLLNLEPKADGPEPSYLLSLLDAPAQCAGWTPSLLESSTQQLPIDSRVVSGGPVVDFSSVESIPCDASFVSTLFENVYREVAKQEPEITHFDTVIGDGDCGTTLLSGAKAVLDVVNGGSHDSLSHILLDVSKAVMDTMGGTSGALYGLFFGAFARSVQQHYKQDQGLSASVFAKSAQDALENLKRYTTAREGSRTLMDTLIPFVRTFSEASTRSDDIANILASSLEAAKKGTEATKELPSSFGRSAYVGAHSGAENGEKHDITGAIPDPGACGVVAVLTGLYSTFSTSK
ncbi:dihydroxyacetone kinase [Exophiala spinifera]|uniref:Dihydroxyacetone kinase n=1 Tax=Exophiala spinifera TaxID=91928 RepID=A0A0D1Z9U2_9EURO|nr:dihydroxyacetone kinase [Exophiala spinifera]KIW09772.1 dihydroxyacetone kinase [Exophiala spinifera]